AGPRDESTRRRRRGDGSPLETDGEPEGACIPGGGTEGREVRRDRRRYAKEAPGSPHRKGAGRWSLRPRGEAGGLRGLGGALPEGPEGRLGHDAGGRRARGMTRAPMTMKQPRKGKRQGTARGWRTVKEYEDILFQRRGGIAKLTINRPSVRNAFRPETLFELSEAFTTVRNDPTIGVAILTGAGDEAFCSGGDQNVRGRAGYLDTPAAPRLNVLDLQKQIRSLPKPVIAMVAGYAIGGGHVLHLVCDLTIAADNAVFGQTGPKVGSFDAGFGAGLLARMVGPKKAKEIWFLCRQYNA